MKKSAVMNTLKKKIREHKYKFTTQRQVILQAFLESKENHMCAEDVYEFVRDNNPEIGLATVYRSLELFTSLELLKKLDFGDGRSRYELNDHNLAHSHYHLICLKCGKVIEFSYDFMNKMKEKIKKEKNTEKIPSTSKSRKKEKTNKQDKISDTANIPCPVCGNGYILKGKSAFGCSEWKNGCTFRINFDGNIENLSQKELLSHLKTYNHNNAEG